jgi:hypothetical protein
MTSIELPELLQPRMPFVVDFTVPIDCFGDAELAATAAAALRDVLGHTLIFLGEEEGKNAPGYIGVGGGARPPIEQTVVVIYNPEERLDP